MQHRHFVLIAQTIAELGRGAAPIPSAQQEMIAHHFAASLRSTNPRFDRERFIACALGAPVSGRDR